MAEFCKDCFLRLNPEYKEEDLVMINEDDLCEGCGKIVSETVLKVRHAQENSTGGKNAEFIYKFCYNSFSGLPEMWERRILRETETSYYIEDVPYKKGGTLILKQWLDTIVFDFHANQYPIMYSFEVSGNYTQYINKLISYLEKEIDKKHEHLEQVKDWYEYQCDLDKERRRGKEDKI